MILQQKNASSLGNKLNMSYKHVLSYNMRLFPLGELLGLNIKFPYLTQGLVNTYSHISLHDKKKCMFNSLTQNEKMGRSISFIAILLIKLINLTPCAVEGCAIYLLYPECTMCFF